MTYIYFNIPKIEDLKQKLQNNYAMYTDGSRNENAIRYSISTEKSVHETGNLKHYSSILATERIAI